MPHAKKVYPARKQTTHTFSLPAKRNLRRRIKLPELPPIDSNHELLNSSGDNSFHVVDLQTSKDVSTEDTTQSQQHNNTFDKLFYGITNKNKQRKPSKDDYPLLNRLLKCSSKPEITERKEQNLGGSPYDPENTKLKCPTNRVDGSIISISDSSVQTIDVSIVTIEDTTLCSVKEEPKKLEVNKASIPSLVLIEEDEDLTEFQITGNIFTSTINTSQCKSFLSPGDILLEKSKEDVLIDTIQNNKETEETTIHKSLDVCPKIILPQLIVTPGKLWRRSLAIAKRKSLSVEKSGGYDQVRNRETHPIFENIQEIALGVRNLEVANHRITKNAKPILTAIEEQNVAQLDIYTRCQQKAPLNFIRTYSHLTSRNCRKIGEGVYGEVFLFDPKKNASSSTVLKVIPIEGELLVNGERQKKYEEILSEIVIVSELSKLVKTEKNRTSVFNHLKKITCVKGKYQHTLRKCWYAFKEEKGTDNDDPSNFERSQLYIVLELDFAGIDLEKYIFNNYTEIFYLFIQVAFGLAVAEKELEFEHRDLHWGNVLVSKVEANAVSELIYDGNKISLPMHGVRGTIIDFTLSRIRCDNQCYYNDLSDDPDLFKAHGDYQFDIYREMQKCNFDNWEKFSPFTNILWLHYLLDKMCTSVLLDKKNSRRTGDFTKLIKLKKEILQHKSASDFVTFRILPLLPSSDCL